MSTAPRAIEVMGWHAPIPGRGRSHAGGPPWQDDSLCSQVGGDVWFPPKGGNGTAVAKRVCAACPVTRPCLEYALRRYERHGVWGGMSERERLAELAARAPGVPRCESGWHPLAGSNLTGDGKCLACDEVRSERGDQTRREAKELAA
jgi:WhiB family redox-sensing transcriptional regulator